MSVQVHRCRRLASKQGCDAVRCTLWLHGCRENREAPFGNIGTQLRSQNVKGTTTMKEKSEELKKTPLDSETGGGGREELATADVKFEDEETKKNSPETAEGSDDVDGRGGKKRKPWKKRPWKRKKRGEQEAEVPEVIMLTPKKAPTIEDLQREVEEAQGIVRNNVEKLVNEREQRLGSLLEKGERLEDAAADFAKVSRRVRIKLCLRANKWRIAAAVGVILAVVVVVVIVVVVLENEGIIKI
ncbi:uncharacterized protein LOC144915394 isoform X2 [Branchiostoma floridae x Branchiostoma belcheri]